MRSKIQSTITLTLSSAGERALPRTSLWQRVGVVAYSKTEARGLNPDWLEAKREHAAALIDEKLAA
jgi:hypothetical protein